MAKVFLDDITIEGLVVRPEFAHLRNVVPFTTTFAPQDWDDNQFGNIIIWSRARADPNLIVALGNTWLGQITGGNISPRTAAIGLKLAMALTSMNPGPVKYLITPQDRPTIAQEGFLAAQNMPRIEDFSDTPYALRVHQVFPAPAAGAPYVSLISTNLSAMEADSDDQKRHAYCFIAAYLMKLLVKDPSNIINGMNNMKTRYDSFYGPCRTMAGFTLTIEQAAAYRKALVLYARIGQTYTHTIANTHQYHYNALTVKEARVLSYLCFLPFSYIGMHAYTLLMELKAYTKISLPKLLALFYCNVTAPGLNKVAQIVADFERTTENPDRSVIFRYCTHWGPQYFYEVRSKQCAHLLCVVVYAWKALAPGHRNSDPDRIAALSTLGASMKNTLQKAGEAAGEVLKKNKLD